MIPEDRIRAIAMRCNSVMTNANSQERPAMIENAIREALLENYRIQNTPQQNAGRL